MKRIYKLGDGRYPTKKAVTARCREILYGSREIDRRNYAFLLDLLALHPESDQKIGVGVSRFYVKESGFGSNVGFWLERADGTHTDWSFVSCLNPPTHEQEVRSALRRLVVDQVLAFRDQSLSANPVCAITGARLTADTAHVDHKPPHTFLNLVARWLAYHRIDYSDIAVKPTEDGSTTTELSSQAFAEDWRGFHLNYAVLQLTSAHANLSQGQGR